MVAEARVTGHKFNQIFAPAIPTQFNKADVSKVADGMAQVVSFANPAAWADCSY